MAEAFGVDVTFVFVNFVVERTLNSDMAALGEQS
jgi:hypothetical protein